MSEQVCPYDIEFEQNKADRIAENVLTLVDISMRFSMVERVPRYTEVKRENNAEHSFMLALVTAEVIQQHYPDASVGLAVQYAMIHDLIELITNDEATFIMTEAQLKQKSANEHEKLDELCDMLPPYIAQLVRNYENQTSLEARLVRMLDKHLPVAVDILGPGSQVMHEDYATFTLEQLDEAEGNLKTRFETMFPDPEFEPLHMARDALARNFREVFKPQRVVQPQLF